MEEKPRDRNHTDDPIMRKIDFLIMGAQKAGTSALDYYLRQHPEICMADKKELHFFDNERVFANSQINYELYEKHFDWRVNKLVYGEATPIYIYWQPCCERIWKYNSDIKLISLLRNPVERAFSHWNMEFNRGNETLSFEQAITSERDRCREALPHQHRIYSYIDRGLYSDQIRRLFRYFKDDQLLFIKYEEFKANPESILNQIFEFIGVQNTNISIKKGEIHKGDYNFTLTPNQREQLLKIYQHNIEETEQLLDWDCKDWKN